MWARLEAGAVAEIIRTPRDVTLTETTTRRVPVVTPHERDETYLDEATQEQATRTVVDQITTWHDETADVSVTHPASIFTAWSAADLAARGIVPASYIDAAPSPHHVAGAESFAIVDGDVAITRTWIEMAVPVPNTVTNFQARAALLAFGMFDAADAAVKALGANSVAFQAWEFANTVSRTSPLILQFAASLGLSDDQLDDLFRAAARIDA